MKIDRRHSLIFITVMVLTLSTWWQLYGRPSSLIEYIMPLGGSIIIAYFLSPILKRGWKK